MTEFGSNEEVKIDAAHAYLIYGLVLAHKPQKILELGLGGGRSCHAIIEGMKLNANQASLTLVDNWCDWAGVMPTGVMEAYGGDATIVTMDEKEYVHSRPGTFDFIMSDADHFHTQEWFDHVYDTLLNPRGILIYHDINLFEEVFPNLREIYEKCLQRKYSHYLFNRSSVPGERCQRGLLVIFKP